MRRAATAASARSRRRCASRRWQHATTRAAPQWRVASRRISRAARRRRTRASRSTCSRALRTTLPRDQELAVASRAPRRAGVTARAISGFQPAAATAAAPLAPRGSHRVRRRARARRTLGRTRSDSTSRWRAAVETLAAVAAFSARALLLQSGNGAAARSALRDVVSRFGDVESAGAAALLLLADLQVDDGDLAGAARSLGELARRYPRERAGAARALPRWTARVRHRSRLARRRRSIHSPRCIPVIPEALPGRYWAARSLERAGRRADATARWTSASRPTPAELLRRAERAATRRCRLDAAGGRRQLGATLAAVDSVRRDGSARCSSSAWTSKRSSSWTRCSSAARATHAGRTGDRAER